MNKTNSYGAAAILVLALGLSLYVDVTFSRWGRSTGNVLMWFVFAWLYYHSSITARKNLISCLVFAFLGEAFLCLGWGLYEYQLGMIPLFVFSGHCLMYTLGVIVAQRMPKAIIYVVPALTLLYVCVGVIKGFDTAALLYFLCFLPCLYYGPEKKLYATMFVLSLILEFYGTWLGVWAWEREVPWVGLTSTNPPICAGVFYCILDLLVTTVTPAVTGWAKKWRTA